MIIELQQLHTVPEVADALRWTPSTTYRVIREGKLRAIRVGGSIRVRPEDLAAFLEQPVVIRVEEEEGPE